MGHSIPVYYIVAGRETANGLNQADILSIYQSIVGLIVQAAHSPPPR